MINDCILVSFYRFPERKYFIILWFIIWLILFLSKPLRCLWYLSKQSAFILNHLTILNCYNQQIISLHKTQMLLIINSNCLFVIGYEIFLEYWDNIFVYDGRKSFKLHKCSHNYSYCSLDVISVWLGFKNSATVIRNS